MSVPKVMENIMQETIPWIEKYRPSSIDDVIMDDAVRAHVSFFLRKRENSHLIITGVPGIGKTSSVRGIARELLGTNMSSAYLELNAADDRGVRSIATIVPPFCKKKLATTTRIILLDEADTMTIKCQYDINSMIKDYGRKTRFIFTCNDSTKILKDIQSVCHIIRLKRLSDEQIKTYLSQICEKEGVPYNEEGLRMICYISEGDMRKAINNLQLTSFSFQNVSKKNVLCSCKVPDPNDINEVIQSCMIRDLVQADERLDKIIACGYYYLDIIKGFIFVLKKSDLNEALKLELIKVITQTQVTVSIGPRSKLQLSAMIARLILVVKEKVKEKVVEKKEVARI